MIQITTFLVQILNLTVLYAAVYLAFVLEIDWLFLEKWASRSSMSSFSSFLRSFQQLLVASGTYIPVSMSLYRDISTPLFCCQEQTHTDILRKTAFIQVFLNLCSFPPQKINKVSPKHILSGLTVSNPNFFVTLESKLSSTFRACPSSTKMSATLVFVVSVLMSSSTRMTLWRMEYSDTMNELPLTSVRKRSRARLLHWSPRMMDWADGRIPQTWNSWAWEPRAEHLSVYVCSKIEVEQGKWLFTFQKMFTT